MRDQNVDVTEGPEPPLDNHGANERQEEMLDEIYQKATEVSRRSFTVVYISSLPSDYVFF